jgi:hypothetical protein
MANWFCFTEARKEIPWPARQCYLVTVAMAEQLPPPLYSQQDPVGSHTYQGPQILIVPTVDVVNFQKGYLGAEGEHAAVEGELQIKGVDAARWDRV